VIELNHVVNDGVITFSQLIYWRWESDGKLHAAAWRRVDENYYVRQVGTKHRDEWFAGGVTYRVIGRAYRERWSQYDPEIEDRKEWPQSRRVWFEASMCN
jgi:hypothetical protein